MGGIGRVGGVRGVHANCDDDGTCEGFTMGSLLGVSSCCFSNWDWKFGLEDFGVCSLLIVMDVCSSFLLYIFDYRRVYRVQKPLSSVQY
jgi:hypothetical protein